MKCFQLWNLVGMCQLIVVCSILETSVFINKGEMHESPRQNSNHIALLQRGNELANGLGRNSAFYSLRSFIPEDIGSKQKLLHLHPNTL